MNDAKAAQVIAWETDPLLWILDNNLKLLGGVKYSIVGHEYQPAIFHEKAKKQCAKKGAQMGFTEICVLNTLHGMVWGRYKRGVLYLFPTRDDVTDFSKGRFAPLITDNEFIGHFVKDTDAANIKRVHKSMLYLRGARSTQKLGEIKKTSSQLKSIPVDKNIYDEVDEMDPEMIQLAKERISHSDVQEEFYLSTPSIPDYGIDKIYDSSDMRVWMIRCRHCSYETCLELEFPNCLKERNDGSVFRACKKCGAEIYPHDGRWIAQYPAKSKEMVGWWLSQLNSPFIDPKEILDLYLNPPNGNLAEVYNSKLGMAYIAAENRLTVNDVYALCGMDAMLLKHHGPCAMGVDVGKDLHVVVGYRASEYMARIIYIGRVGSFNDVRDIAIRYNVSAATIDIEPETRAAREFQQTVPFEVYLCDYSEHQIKEPVYNEHAKIVSVNRTEICDTTHSLFTTPGKLILPRQCTEISEYAKEMSNIAKVLEEDKDTGSKIYRYRKLGPEHYRHATNYFALSLNRVTIAPKTPNKNKRFGFTQLNRSGMAV